MRIEDISAAAPVIPVLVIRDLAAALPLAEALVAGGLPVLEITLRRPVALEAIARIAAALPEAVVGAGTIRTAGDIAAARAAGAAFGVSPGAPPALLDALDADRAAHGSWPFLPGCATATEAMTLAERGYGMVKFFPAEAAGGVPLLRSLAAPLPDLAFCPTGGIDAEKARDYLALPNVAVVGGSWLVTEADLAAKDWRRIESRARLAAALPRR